MVMLNHNLFMTVLGRQVKRESNKNTKEARLSANSILTVVPSFSLSINFTAEDFFHIWEHCYRKFGLRLLTPPLLDCLLSTIVLIVNAINFHTVPAL